MPEGVAVAGGPVLAGAVHDDPSQPPPPGPAAPKGWTWNRSERVWQPRRRGSVKWQPAAGNEPAAPEELASVSELGRDPAPGWAQPSSAAGRDASAAARGDGSQQLSFDDVPQQVKDDIAGFAGLVGTPILAVARSIDPYCGGALAENFENVVDKTLPLICRSERIVKYFSEDTADWLLWGKVAMALAPVGKAIAEHHILHTVEVVRDEKTGAVTIKRVSKDGPNLAQTLTPPAADPQAYAA